MSRRRPNVIDGLDVNEVKDGLVVYESASDRVHYLNASAAITFTLCDGSRSADEMADVMALAFDLDDPPRVETEACLETLFKEGLLQ